MTFSSVPDESRAKINRTGRILVSNPKDKDALRLADKWRVCHAYPINTFQATLREKVKKFGVDVIVAQRLKRMPTIIDKLKRFPAMQLTTMQDIGGVRAVLGSVRDVYQLVDDYLKNSRFAHELVNQKNYIENPRDEDGYRSIHLIYKYKNKRTSDYDDLRVELQIRSRLQHIWATAVETMGTFLGQALKSRHGDKKWLEFFAIISSAFAYQEGCKPLPIHKNLSCEETFKAVFDSEKDLRAIDIMRAFSVVIKATRTRKKKKSWYHLIVLNSLKRTVRIIPFDRNSLEEAHDLYSRIETNDSKEREAVLVSAGPFDQLRRAYPNFFLDINDFVEEVEKIINQNKG